MTDHDNDNLDRSLDAAFTARAAAVSSSAPPFDDIIERSQHGRRRTLAAATLGLVALGAVGLLAINASDNDTSRAVLGDALPVPSDQNFVGSTTTVSGQTWACAGPLGSSSDGSLTYFQSCQPQYGPSDQPPWPTTTTVPPDDSAALGPCAVAPDALATTTTNLLPCNEAMPVTESTVTEFGVTTTVLAATVAPCTIPGCEQRYYTIKMGDYPLAVTDPFCITIDELVAANGWSSINEFPFPGEVIIIPPRSSDNSSCP